MKDRTYKYGFSLVELSIVLVILGLLVGGVLSGRSLIRAAELRSVTSEYAKFVTSINSFRDKYFSLPGDMPNAFQFWGPACGTNSTIIATGCNGNGEGIIFGTLGEGMKAWEHLSRAGLIEGSYSGSGTLVSGYTEMDESNSPKSKFPNAMWTFYERDILDSNPLGSGVNYINPGTAIQIGSSGSGGAEKFSGITNSEVWTIDSKIDDGHACTGNVRGQDDDDNPCGLSGTLSYRIGAPYDPLFQNNVLTFIVK
jgi:prepilin-type N-terminal cleavage/methylation domain-containing protein